MRPRGSIVGPLILITIGVVFLLRTVWPGFSVFDVFAVYWPYLLIAWGVLQIIEISVRARSRGPIPRNGITAGGWFLVLLICLVGFTMFEVHGPETWWRRVSFNQGMDWFGEARPKPRATHPILSSRISEGMPRSLAAMSRRSSSAAIKRSEP